MNVFDTLNNASRRVFIRCVIIRHPDISKVLYIGSPQSIPNNLLNRITTSHLYDAKKERLIMRVRA